MRKLALFLILVFPAIVGGQTRFDVADAPGYDVSYDVEKCDSDYCFGALKVWINKSGRKKRLQEFSLETDFEVKTSPKKLNRISYRDQHVVNFTDVNFDNIADLTIRNGRDSGYGSSSYNIYLYSPTGRRFVYNAKLSSLATGPYLGMFEVDRKGKLLRTYSKSGCCMHETEEYKIINGRIVKVFSEFEDLTVTDEKSVRITTKRLVRGKWKTSVKYAKPEK